MSFEISSKPMSLWEGFIPRKPGRDWSCWTKFSGNGHSKLKLDWNGWDGACPSSSLWGHWPGNGSPSCWCFQDSPGSSASGFGLKSSHFLVPFLLSHQWLWSKKQNSLEISLELPHRTHFWWKKEKKKKNEANEKFLPVFHPGILRNRSFYRDLIWLIKPGIFSWSLHRNSYTLFISFSSSRPVEFPGTAKEGKGKTSSLVQVIPNILPGGKYWKRGYLQDIWIPEKELYPLRKKKKN